MNGTSYRTKEAVLKRAQEAIGIPLGEIDKTGRLRTGKGAVGTTIEESWYGYAPNSESDPDFPEAGVELKAAAYLQGRTGVRAKERLVCNIINYMEEHDKTFETSSFWHKCQTLLLLFYQHLDGVPKTAFTIEKALLFQFPPEDLAVIRQDWETIMGKVRAGQAHLLSEGDTFYLAACTKGASAKTLREQPFSPLKAKQRAYSLKASYMTRLLQTYVFGEAQSERVVKDWRDLRQKRFDRYVVEKIAPYTGMTQAQLQEALQVHSTAKNLNELLLAKMLGVRGRIAATEEFRRAQIFPRTVRVRRDGSIRESMPFPAFDPVRISQESIWEQSVLYEQLAPARFLFVVFQETDSGDYVLDRVQFWNIPEADLAEVGRVWERTVQTLKRGVRLTPTPRGVGNDLPKQAESPVAHVRPHGRDGRDTCSLPDGRQIIKQSFWLNNTYIAQQLRQTGGLAR